MNHHLKKKGEDEGIGVVVLAAKTTYANVSFRGKDGGRIFLNKKGLAYHDAKSSDDDKPSLRIYWKSLKSHFLNRKNLLVKLINYEKKALIFKLQNVKELERIYSDIAQRKEAWSLDGSGSNNSLQSETAEPLSKNVEMGDSNNATKKTSFPRRNKATISGRCQLKNDQRRNKATSSGRYQLKDDESKEETLSRHAVSVYYLQTVFLKEVQEAGMDPSTARIHEIEDLHGPPGVIRTKGLAKRCPIDGRKGAAYVHCIHGDDNVGIANFMLSYSWSYTIGDIVVTLVDYCKTHSHDPKRTYVWMCCLCVNQHRVVQKSGATSGILEESKVDFFSLFSDRVTGIGHLLAMMSPWDNPAYLRRVWCVFEMYTAHDTGCAISIVMPPEQKRSLEQSLFEMEDEKTEGSSIDKLFEVLEKTRVQDAQASVEQDRIAILSTIHKAAGYRALNHRVNELLRGWVRTVISEIMEKRHHESIGSEDLEYSGFCCKVGTVLERHAEYDAALDAYEQALSIRQSVLGDDHSETAACLNHKGDILYHKGLHSKARVLYEKALSIYLLTKGGKDSETADSYHKIGENFLAQNRTEEASTGLLKALAIREKLLGIDHLDTCKSYIACGSLYRKKGEYKASLSFSTKALNFCEAKLSGSHPSLASAYNNLGVLYFEWGRYDVALSHYGRCLVVYESLFGKDHPWTACLYNNCGTALMRMGHADFALEQFQKALAIRREIFGEDHFQVAESHSWIGYLFLEKKQDYKAAEVHFRKALNIRLETAGREHSETAACRYRLAKVLFSDGNLLGAMAEYRECLRIYDCISTNKMHPSKVDAYLCIERILEQQGDEEEALKMARKANKIAVSAYGRDSRWSTSCSSTIDRLVQKLGTTGKKTG